MTHQTGEGREAQKVDGIADGLVGVGREGEQRGGGWPGAEISAGPLRVVRLPVQMRIKYLILFYGNLSSCR